MIAQAAELGFDFVEIPLLRPDEFDSALIGRELSRNRIEGVTSLCLPKELHMPINPKGALEFLKKAADRIADFGGKILYGCTYCNLGTLTGAPPTAQEKKTIADTLRELHGYAKEKGFKSPSNQSTATRPTSATPGLTPQSSIRQIGADDIVIHFDTYHMNIEEEGYSGPLKEAGACAATSTCRKATGVFPEKAQWIGRMSLRASKPSITRDRWCWKPLPRSTRI